MQFFARKNYALVTRSQMARCWDNLLLGDSFLGIKIVLQESYIVSNSQVKTRQDKVHRSYYYFLAHEDFSLEKSCLQFAFSQQSHRWMGRFELTCHLLF